VSDTALIEELFNTYQVNVAGPSTITAMLNSLQIGFRTLQIEQKSSQVWAKLSEVKTEFAKYADALEKVHDRIKKADQEMAKLITTRTNAMTRKLRDISSDELETHEEITEDRLLTIDESLK
jgi:DNA recombination protein RmuC